MSSFRWRHLLLAPIPLIGWALLIAILLDGEDSGPEVETDRSNAEPARTAAAFALAIDALLPCLLSAICPPALSWLLGSAHILARDVQRGRYSLGRLLTRAPARAGYGWTASYFANLPLLFPLVGPLTELVLIARGSRTLGDRLRGWGLEGRSPWMLARSISSSTFEQ